MTEPVLPLEVVTKAKPANAFGHKWEMDAVEHALYDRALVALATRNLLVSVWPTLSWWRKVIGVCTRATPSALSWKIHNAMKKAVEHFRMRTGVEDWLDADVRKEPWRFISQGEPT